MSPIQSNLRRLRDRLSPLPEHGDGQLSASSTPQVNDFDEKAHDLTNATLTINPVYTPLTSAQKPPWSAQQTMNSNDTKSDPDPSEFASLFRDALDEFSKRTEIDLATNPLTRQFMTCDSIDKVMVILENQVQKFNEFRHGGIKMQLIRKLHPLVTVILTLSRSEILLEGLEAAFGPSVAVVAALGVLLEAAKGVSASYDALSELLDCITSFLVRLEVFTRMQLSPAMRAILVKTLVHVISVLSLAIEQVKQGRLVAYFKRLLGNKDVEKALHELERLTVEQAQMTGVESLELIYNLVNSLSVTMKNGQVPTGPIRESLDRLGACLSGMRQDIDELKHDNILQQHRDWLSPPDPSRYYNVAIKLYHKSTGRWLIESEPMQRWKRMGSLLWIHGKPGSGKTVMCSAIIEDLARLCIVQLKSVLIYFYCDYADSTTQSVRGLLSHLVLCIPTRTRSDVCTEILSHLYSKNDNGGQQPSDDELEECLQEMLEQTADYSVYIVIDAVDECPSSGIPSMRTRMLELITRITGWQIKNVRICLTSRPEPDVRDVLDRLSPLTITLHEGSGQAQDIATYVRSVMESDPGFRLWNGEDKALAMQELSEKANGMFRWVYCQLDMLRGCQRANIRQVLRNLPRTLDETYQRMLKDLDTENWKYTHRLFQCLVVYSRPLRINELAEVVAIDFKSLAAPGVKADWRPSDPEGALSYLCSSMILVDRRTQTVNFSHSSVQEYLTSTRLALEKDDTLRQFHVLAKHAHSTLATACLGTLLQFRGPTDDVSRRTTSSPLAKYAAVHWVTHVEKAGDMPVRLRDASRRMFDPHKQHLAAAVQISRVVGGFVYHTADPLHVAAAFGLYDIAQHLLVVHHVMVNAKGGVYNGPALELATQNAHVEIVRLLVNHGANVNADGGKYRSALQAACVHGHPLIARLLVEHGANVNMEGGEYGTALQAAAAQGQVDITRLLIEHGANVNAVGGVHGSALHAASANGRPVVVRLLVEHGADVNAKNAEGQHPLLLASENGRIEVARVLLMHGADVNAKGGKFGFALQAAAPGRYPEVVRLLLEHGANVNAEGGEYGSALRAAAVLERPMIAQLLINHGADVNAKDVDGRSMLEVASQNGRIEVARIFIKRGADVNAKSKHGSALHAACRCRHPDVVHLLLEHGAGADEQGGKYVSTLHTASVLGRPKVMEILIEHGVDVNAKDPEGKSALQAAAQNGHLDVVRILLEHGADVQAADGPCGSALQAASLGGHSEVVRLLIAYGAK